MAIKPMLLTVKYPIVKSFSFKEKFLLKNQKNVSEYKLSMWTVFMSLALSSLPNNTFQFKVQLLY